MILLVLLKFVRFGLIQNQWLDPQIYFSLSLCTAYLWHSTFDRGRLFDPLGRKFLSESGPDWQTNILILSLSLLIISRKLSLIMHIIEVHLIIMMNLLFSIKFYTNNLIYEECQFSVLKVKVFSSCGSWMIKSDK